ncbi:hypothetical protein FDP41_007803 [Naegleria fowleri]|uniref:Uncharacterized protein n=1 Tax=Naegleria fowleri TaxID=5763 RepID=A0A6A5CEG6_NAEFO|nr:uncharacterized protein FDP41_007803 [Naegleria fowleri]KAF0983888.1 hypothetical protein FDP41_007803 [Naegleria fowleri]
MAKQACCSFPFLKHRIASDPTTTTIHPVKYCAKYSIVFFLKMLFNGVQWMGWLWAVTISEQVSLLLNLVEWRDLLVMFSITCNEILCSQLFGRLLLVLEKKLWTFNTNEQQDYWIGIYKGMLGCVASGIMFDFVDRAASKYFQKVMFSDVSVLVLRCLFVFTLDRAVYAGVIFFLNQLEYISRIKEMHQEHPSCKNAETTTMITNNNHTNSNITTIRDSFKSPLFNEFLTSYSFSTNIEGASIAGYSAILYNLSTELGIYISNHLGTPNTVWIQSGVSSPLVLIFTAFAMVLSMMELTLFCISKRLLLYVTTTCCWLNRRANDHS